MKAKPNEEKINEQWIAKCKTTRKWEKNDSWNVEKEEKVRRKICWYFWCFLYIREYQGQALFSCMCFIKTSCQKGYDLSK